MPKSCKAKHYANGGMISGPGTGTSDEVPARVVQTKEPLAVSTGERIVSVAQDKFLSKMAKSMGHKNLDSMLEAGTGKPVGPTLKYIDHPGSRIASAAKAPVKHAGLGAMIDSAKRAVGMLPPQTMREKFAEKDASRAPAPAVQPAAAPATPAATTPAPMGSQGVLDKRMAAAGAANGAKVKPVMAAGLGGLIDSAKRAVGILPPQTMREKIAAEDAKRAPAAAAVPAAAPASAPTGVQGGLDGSGGNSLENRMKAAGAARGAKIKPKMAAQAKKKKTEDEADDESMIGMEDADPVQGFSNGGMFSGGDPYAIPGYTPGLIQRGGIGLAGYNPLTQGQTLNVPQVGGDVNADDIKETEAKGFANGGAIGQVIKLPFISTGFDHSNVQDLGPGLGGRQIMRAAEDGVKIEDPDGYLPGESILGRAGRRIQSLLPTPGSRGMELGAPDFSTGMPTVPAGAGRGFVNPALAGQQVASQEPAAAAANPAAAPYPEPVQTRNPILAAAAPAAPATAPATPAAPARLSGSDGVDVGNGVTRFNAPGKSPLFTNMTDAAGMASNQALQNRGAITPQNMAAADALAGRYQREAQNTNQRAANATQMATETAQAQHANEAGGVLADKVGRRIQNELDVQNGEATLSQRMARPAELANAQRKIDAARARTGEEQISEGTAIREAARDALTRRSQDLGDKHFGEQNAIARSRLTLDQSTEGRNSKSFDQQQQHLQKVTALQDAIGKAKTGPERDALMAQLLAMTGKEPSAHFETHLTPSIKNVDGSTTQGAAVTLDKRTGQTQVVPLTPAATPTEATNAKLLANPHLAPDYDAKFGAGAAAKLLSQK